jgi:16S rRNA (cytidine1402-2'-O)-methyltransferase
MHAQLILQGRQSTLVRAWSKFLGMEGKKHGTLYVVATPIGNLEDITQRALRTLKEVECIASEDTRTTRKLLKAHGVCTPLKSYHEQGPKGRGGWVIRKLEAGRNVALVSEAGTPGISDPGYDLIRTCLSSGFDVVPIPGPSAVLAALSVGGLPTDRFVFEGFLPRRRAQRIKALRSLRGEQRTLVFFESPKRLRGALSDMFAVLGDRRVVLAREVTKTFEEILRGSLGELLDLVKHRELRGEFSILVAGREEGEVFPLERLRERVAFLREKCGVDDKTVVRILRGETGLPGKTIYREVLVEKHDG